MTPPLSDTPREAAERIVARMKRRYSSPPTIVRTNESEFTHLDLNAYRSFRDTMEREGYKFLSDVKILGISDSPQSQMAPTMIRVMVSPDGGICAGHYQVKPKIGFRLTSLLAGLINLRFISEPRLFLQSLKTKGCCDFESELGSTYVVTSNAEVARAMSLPKSVDTKFFAFGTSVDELRAAHEARLRAAAQRTGTRPTSMATIEDVFAMQARLQERKNAHRVASNYITRNELRALSGGNTAVADALFEEIQMVLTKSSRSSQ